MHRTRAGAGLAVLGLGFLAAFGCSPSSGPATPVVAPNRTYHFVIDASGYPVVGASVEARTDAATYSATGDSHGGATILIPNGQALPDHVVFTANSFAIMPAAVAAGAQAGLEADVLVHCSGRPGTILVRGATLKRLGDGIADGGTANEFQVSPDGTQADFAFALFAIPTRMPAYRLSVRGLEALVELRVNGHLVGRLRPSSDVNALTVQSDTLLGVPANVFELTQNVFTIKTVGLPSNPANLDDVELGALLVYYP